MTKGARHDKSIPHCAPTKPRLGPPVQADPPLARRRTPHRTSGLAGHGPVWRGSGAQAAVPPKAVCRRCVCWTP